MRRIVMLMLLGLLVAGCSGDPPDRRALDSQVDTDAGSSDSGREAGLDGSADDTTEEDGSGDAGDTSPSDVSDTGDVRDADTSDTGGAPAPTEADHLCSAAGVTSGGGLTLTQCVGPAEPTGPTTSGGDLQLQSGSLRLMTP